MFTCQSHGDVEAPWECPDCQAYYCDACVKTVKFGRTTSRMCTPCDALCLPVSQMQPAVSATSSLSGLLSYPFTGAGPLTLFAGVIVLGICEAFLGLPGAIVSWGLVAGYSMTIIRASAMGSDELPEWPDFTDLGSIGRPALLSLMTGLVSFGPAVWLAKEQSFGLAALALAAGVAYAPMAWIAVARYGRVFAVTPFVVFPLIARAGAEYWLASALLLGIGIVEAVGQLALIWFLPVFVGAFVVKTFSLYFLAIEMRILGIVWNRREFELGFQAEE